MSYATPTFQGAIQQLYSPKEVDKGEVSRISSEDMACLQDTLAWVRTFIARPHKDLGRSGAVCPFVRPSLQQYLLYLTVCRFDAPLTVEAMYQRLVIYGNILQRMEPTQGESAKLRSILMVLPEMDDALADALMPDLHTQLKTTMLYQGILTGQFYPTCPVPATWNPQFFPLQSPVPMFAIRPLLETDWRFLRGNTEWERTYERFYPMPQA